MHMLNHRVLAFDIHPGRIAYFVLEGPTQALCWGVKTFGTGSHQVKISPAAKVRQLISEWQPHAVVMRHSAHPQSMEKAQVVKRQATLASVPVEFLTSDTIRSAFPTEQDRYARAQVIATAMPELAAEVPKKPRAWEREPYGTWFFDAASVGFAYFKRLEQSRS